MLIIRKAEEQYEWDTDSILYAEADQQGTMHMNIQGHDISFPVLVMSNNVCNHPSVYVMEPIQTELGERYIQIRF